jgi:hypothetical protein
VVSMTLRQMHRAESDSKGPIAEIDLGRQDPASNICSALVRRQSMFAGTPGEP